MARQTAFLLSRPVRYVLPHVRAGLPTATANQAAATVPRRDRRVASRESSGLDDRPVWRGGFAGYSDHTPREGRLTRPREIGRLDQQAL